MKQKKIRLIVFSVALFLVLGGMVLAQREVAKEYMTLMRAGYRRQTEELAAAALQISENLEIALLTSSRSMLTRISEEVWRISGFAAGNITDLPLSEYNTEQLMKYFSQVGDYMLVLSRSGRVTERNRQDITLLYEYSLALSDELSKMSESIGGSEMGYVDVSVPQLKKTAYLSLSLKLPDAGEALSSSLSGLKGYPELVYEGEFSQHISALSPAFLEGKAEITAEKAAEIAAGCLGVDKGALGSPTESGGKIASYDFNSDGKSVSISKAGGYPIRLISEKTGTMAVKTPEELAAAGKKELARLGFENMELVAHEIHGPIMYMKFAVVDRGVICYPDTVSLQYCMETGTLCALDSTAYLQNHVDGRILPKMSSSPKALLAGLSPALRPERYRLALIGDDAKIERLVLEVEALSPTGASFTVYLSDEGEELDIVKNK